MTPLSFSPFLCSALLCSALYLYLSLSIYLSISLALPSLSTISFTFALSSLWRALSPLGNLKSAGATYFKFEFPKRYFDLYYERTLRAFFPRERERASAGLRRGSLVKKEAPPQKRKRHTRTRLKEVRGRRSRERKDFLRSWERSCLLLCCFPFPSFFSFFFFLRTAGRLGFCLLIYAPRSEMTHAEVSERDREKNGGPLLLLEI